jgi:hypothetical protein
MSEQTKTEANSGQDKERAQPKLVLIHGNSIGIKFPMRDRLTKYGSFSVFEKLIDSGVALLYGWHYINEDFGLLKTLNPFEFRRQYLTEKRYCNSKVAWLKLNRFLRQQQAEKIVCHSMGCFLLLNTINIHGLPNTIKSIYLAQGDFDRNFKLTNPEVLARIDRGDLKIYNYHCNWDQMLTLSIAANGVIPGGLAGASEKYFTNRLFPSLPGFNVQNLGKNLNVHHATINSDRFLREVLEE